MKEFYYLIYRSFSPATSGKWINHADKERYFLLEFIISPFPSLLAAAEIKRATWRSMLSRARLLGDPAGATVFV